MSSNTCVYFNLRGNKKTIDKELALLNIKKTINDIVKKSYEKYDINNFEKNSRFPLIRNRATLDKYEVTVGEYNGKGHSFYQGVFTIFCSEEQQGGFPKGDFNHVNSDFDAPRQCRVISIFTPNQDIKNHLIDSSDFNPEKDKYMSISLSDDNIGQELTKVIAENLSSEFQSHKTYYKRTDLNDEIQDFTKKKTRKKVNKP